MEIMGGDRPDRTSDKSKFMSQKMIDISVLRGGNSLKRYLKKNNPLKFQHYVGEARAIQMFSLVHAMEVVDSLLKGD